LHFLEPTISAETKTEEPVLRPIEQIHPKQPTNVAPAPSQHQEIPQIITDDLGLQVPPEIPTLEPVVPRPQPPNVDLPPTIGRQPFFTRPDDNNKRKQEFNTLQRLLHNAQFASSTPSFNAQTLPSVAPIDTDHGINHFTPLPQRPTRKQIHVGQQFQQIRPESIGRKEFITALSHRTAHVASSSIIEELPSKPTLPPQLIEVSIPELPKATPPSFESAPPIEEVPIRPSLTPVKEIPIEVPSLTPVKVPQTTSQPFESAPPIEEVPVRPSVTPIKGIPIEVPQTTPPFIAVTRKQQEFKASLVEQPPSIIDRESEFFSLCQKK
jgi:hypothetical protein